MDAVITFFSVLLGGGSLTFVQFLINRHDQKHDKNKGILDRLEELSKKVDRVESSLDERDAVLARTHILRFRDELYNDIRHSQEYFEQTLDDIQTYDLFCSEHPKFANGRTKAAAKYIQDEYDRLFKAHKL
jgi:hypothetical protein